MRQTKTAKLTDLLCFLYNIFFLCYFYSRSLYCFNQLFSSGKVDGSEKNRLFSGVVWKMVSQMSQVLFEMITIWSGQKQASSLIRHWSVASSTMLCYNSRHVSTRCCRSSSFFCISLGSAVTFFRWSGQIYSQLVSTFLGSPCTKNYRNLFIFHWVISKIERGTFFGTQCIYAVPSDVTRT